ncbi:hypothetical protein FB45DRAFT_1059975 [Roridomyces roridus]|uniref:DUF6534 domain-containing protein n=1 Tax=Roridomyces roridus TaxID=1738132 RepID=A0AAD7BPY9_9AGAR|nr:hypothetical protein FB45DRAFT_1059975 [Roridomyces roridus]
MKSDEWDPFGILFHPMDAVTGPLLIGTWMSSILYSAELAQAAIYYQNFKNDKWCLKALVWTTVLIDTVGLLNDYACVYLYTIKHAGDVNVAYFADQNATIPVYVFTTVAVALPVQIFLVVRYWRFTHKKITVLVLAILILVAFGGSFTCGLMVALFPAFKDRHKLAIPATLWLVTGAAADLGIAAALLWEFLQAKPGTSPKMRNVINRLVAVTVQTGAATATIAVAALIGFMLHEEGNIGVGFAWCLGRTYVLSMLSNLNIRKMARRPAPSVRLPTIPRTRTSVIFGQPGSDLADTDTFTSRQYANQTAPTIDSQVDVPPEDELKVKDDKEMTCGCIEMKVLSSWSKVQEDQVDVS